MTSLNPVFKIGYQIEEVLRLHKGMSKEEARKAAINAVRQLAIDVGIPQKLSDIGASKDDLQALSELAMSDACTPGNPKDPTVEEIKAIYEKAF